MQTAKAGRDPGHLRWRPDGLRKAAPIVFGMALLLVSAMAAPPGSAQSNAALGVNTSFGTVNTSFGAATTASSATLSATPTTATASSDLLVATIEVRGVSTLNTVTGVSDSTSDTWVMAVRRTHSGLQDGEIWYAVGANALTSTGSVTVSASSASSIAFTVLDVGGASTIALDVTGTAAGRSTAGYTGTTPTTRQPSEISIAEVGWNSQVTPSPLTAGYTQTATEQSLVSGHATGEQAAWKLLTKIGRQNYKATFPSIVNWIGAIATFRNNPIKHIVLFYQENHSFDNVLGALCAANTRKTPCDGTTTGKLPNGSTIPLSSTPDIVPDLDHSAQGQTTDINGGKMDGFATVSGCNAPSYTCYSEYQTTAIPNATALATTFAVSDRTFELSPVPSWGAHLELVAQTLDGFLGDNPFYNPSASPPPMGNGWGCDSNNDEYWTAPGGATSSPVPACIPDPSLNPVTYPNGGAYRATPVQHVDTIMDRLDAASLSWKLYTSDYDWAICPTFADCLDTSQKQNMVAPTQFTTDAQNGTLPNFSILLPQGGISGSTSQHNGTSMAAGDNWIGAAVQAVENGPDWSSTAIFITWDDCGCFYDHVAPPISTEGIRVPMIIVSPYAKPGYTDSNNASFASMLAYTEATLGLAPLGTNDAGAYNYSGAFDYNQTPLGPVTLTHQTIPPAEQQYLAAHPPNPNDPT